MKRWTWPETVNMWIVTECFIIAANLFPVQVLAAGYSSDLNRLNLTNKSTHMHCEDNIK